VLHEPSGPFPTSQYEHSSIPATVKKIFNLPEFLTKRDAWAGTFEGLLTLSTPRTDCPGKISIFVLYSLIHLSCAVTILYFCNYMTFGCEVTIVFYYTMFYCIRNYQIYVLF